MCKAAWGWGADGSERFLSLEPRVPSCAQARTCLCPTALCRGPETKALSQTEVDGEGQNGLMVDTGRDAWPAPRRCRTSVVLGAPAQTSDFPFLTSANRVLLCAF